MNNKNYKKKAEEYVRRECGLDKLEFGCELQKNIDKSTPVYIGQDGDDEDLRLFVDRSVYCPTNGDDAYNITYGIDKNDVCENEIIGSPIHLEHWLQVLAKHGYQASVFGDGGMVLANGGDVSGNININLKTGQPEDYKAICELLNI